ncbi:MAG: hypothetical protein WCS43_07085 [Verrucomicrobiota bacterium]
MNTPDTPSNNYCWLARLPLLIAAGLLLRASWLPVIEIKGFDTFAFESLALWATRSARVTLVIVLVCLLFRPMSLSRWWMALSVGILVSPLTDMVVRAADLAEMMKSQIDGDMTQLIILRTGTWFCVAGLSFWLLDLAVAGVRLLLAMREKNRV